MNGKAVCEGYARAIAYLMQKSGIECSEAAGHVTKNGTNDKNGGAHAWNIIRIDGEYYYMDSTWDDDSNTIQTVKHEDFGYDYFCITSEELLRTRRSDLCPVDMPICSAVSANYYYHNDLILTKFDLEELKTLIKNNVKAGADRFAFKCRSMSVYKETIEKLFGGAGMATQLIKEAARINRRIDTSGYSYSYNAELYTVTIRLCLRIVKEVKMRKIVTLLIVICAMMVCACSTDKSIVGTWKSQSTVLGVVTETTYVFNEDGSGSKRGIVDIPFTYSIDGNKLTITTNVIGVDISTKEYAFERSGDILELRSGNEYIKLTKEK